MPCSARRFGGGVLAVAVAVAWLGAPRALRAQSAADETVDDEGSLRAVTMVGFRYRAELSRVFVRTNARARYSVHKEGPTRVVVEIQNAYVPLRNNRRPLDTSHFPSKVKRVQAVEVEGGTPTVQVVIELREEASFTHKQVGNEIWVDIPN